jgi:hypothetical protein
MDRLTAVDRFVFFALRRSEGPLSHGTLVRLTGLCSAELQKALNELEFQGLVKRLEHPGEICYLPISLSQSPLLPNCKEWLDIYCSRPELVEEGDTETMTNVSCGFVILAAVLTGSRDAQFLTGLTILPHRFILHVVRLMDRLELWSSLLAFDLERTIRQDATDFAVIGASLQSLTEEFYDAWWSPDSGATLNTLRASQQYGGKRDSWFDDNALTLGPFLVM